MIKGGCLCGAIRYTVRGEITEVTHCHCTMCRKQHGAAFATFGAVRSAELEWTEGQESMVYYASSTQLERAFCPRCGSSLLCRSPAEPEVEYVALGTVDGDPGCRPELHIWVDSKAPWFEITDTLPQQQEEEL